MAGATVATGVKVRTKTGLTSRPISHKYEDGASYARGDTITQSEYERIKSRGDTKRKSLKELSDAKKIESSSPVNSNARKRGNTIGADVKKESDMSGKVLSRGKSTGGFSKVSVEIPVQGRYDKREGLAIGDFLVEKSGGKSYQVSHIPTGMVVLNSRMMENWTGGSAQINAKNVAKKLHNADLPLASTLQGQRNISMNEWRGLTSTIESLIKTK